MNSEVSCYKRNNNQPDSILNKAWTEQEVMKVVRNGKINTAMGNDFFHQKLLTYGREQIVPRLTKLFNFVYVIHCSKSTRMLERDKPESNTKTKQRHKYPKRNKNN